MINGGAGNDTLEGLGGSDTYLFADGFGTDTVVEAAGGGALDTLDFSAVTHDLLFTITPAGQTVGYGSNLVSASGLNIEALIGGSGNDTFALTGTASFPGTLDGGEGSNTLDYSAYGSA